MRQRYVYEMAGNNFRMTDLQAALCLPQLADYAHQVETRQRNAARLNDGLRGLTGVRVPEALPRSPSRVAPVHDSRRQATPG
jgi:dTDP-4-amino-4,6-dideoxygalactose transaminase